MSKRQGRPKESYRAYRRNNFKKDWPEYSEYNKVYTLKYPQLIKRISNRGEVHYVSAREEDIQLG